MVNKLTTQEFVERANNIHDNKYSYPEPYINSRSLIKIICPIHGVFTQLSNNHLMGHGCNECGSEYAKNLQHKQKKLHSEFVEQANFIHNNKYSYNDPYMGVNNILHIECPKHGLFEQTPKNHLLGGGCTICAKKVSAPETAWLDSIGIPFELRQASLKIDDKLIRPDAFDPATNTIYEFYGDYYHGNPKVFSQDLENKTVKKTFGKLYQDTIDREQLIKKAGYNLIFIWEYDWKNE